MSALEGLKVLDFSRLLPGPYCSWMLSELGAEVTRIENPREVVKQRRVFGWDRLSEAEQARIRAQDMLARGKRSLMLDIGHDAARAVVMKIAAGSDIVVSDYRPGVLEGLGLGPDDLEAVNPALIHCSVTLCGQTGPYRDRPGHDPLAMAISGAMSRAGDREERPSSVGLAVADVMTGTNAALAVLAAVIERGRTGKGKRLDLAMSDSAMCLNANVLSRHPDLSTIPPRGRRRADTGIWRCKDGEFIATSDMEPRYWERFCALAGHPEWVPLQLDPARREEICDAIAAMFETRTRAEWEEALAEAGTQFAPVLSVAEALENEHNIARGMVREVAGAAGPVRQLSLPLGPTIGRDGTGGTAVMPGTDRDRVLADAGLSEEEIAALERAGLFG
jgi:crotonobetainyl-CoA:carnitine CoA-transferase CaiB-like acyl-CoA transferase